MCIEPGCVKASIVSDQVLLLAFIIRGCDIRSLWPHSLTVFWCLVSRVSLRMGKTGNELCEIGQIEVPVSPHSALSGLCLLLRGQ